MNKYNKTILTRNLLVLSIMLTASCMAKPDIHLKSGDMSMDVNKSAFIVITATYSPDGRFVLSGGRENRLMLWDVTAGKQIRQFEGHSDTITAVGFFPNGKYTLSGSRDKTIKLWDVSNGKAIKTINLVKIQFVVWYFLLMGNTLLLLI